MRVRNEGHECHCTWLQTGVDSTFALVLVHFRFIFTSEGLSRCVPESHCKLLQYIEKCTHKPSIKGAGGREQRHGDGPTINRSVACETACVILAM